MTPDVERHLRGEAGLIRLRRWHRLHYEACPGTHIEAVRIDDPAYDKPLLVGTTACELTSEECALACGHRWPVGVSREGYMNPVGESPTEEGFWSGFHVAMQQDFAIVA